MKIYFREYVKSIKVKRFYVNLKGVDYFCCIFSKKIVEVVGFRVLKFLIDRLLIIM